eukprot:346776_1
MTTFIEKDSKSKDNIMDILVSGYIRDELSDVPNDIMMLFLMFYPNIIGFEENIFNLSINEKELITSWFVKVFDLDHKNTSKAFLDSKILFDSSVYGMINSVHIMQCKQQFNLFTIIQTGYGHIFGFFSSIGTSLYIPSYEKRVFISVIRSTVEDVSPGFHRHKSHISLTGNRTFGRLGLFRLISQQSVTRAIWIPDMDSFEGHWTEEEVLGYVTHLPT